jgi:hypothetical protein
MSLTSASHVPDSAHLWQLCCYAHLKNEETEVEGGQGTHTGLTAKVLHPLDPGHPDAY